MTDDKEKVFKEFIELEIFADLTQDVIVTTEDKLKLSLSKYQKGVERKMEWITPLSIFLTILTVLLTSSFRNFGLSSNTWEAIFILVGLGSFVWLIYSLRFAFKPLKIEDIIVELKTNKKKMDKNG